MNATTKKNFFTTISDGTASPEVTSLLKEFFDDLRGRLYTDKPRMKAEEAEQRCTQDREMPQSSSTPISGNPGRFSRPNESITMVDLVSALSRLDNKPTPAPEVFDMCSGQTLKDFLTDFEEYADRKFGGQRHKWGTELRTFLSGEPLVAFDALRTPGENYDLLRGKLTDWLRSSQDKLEYDARRRFSDARKGADERVRLYAARLEKLFNLAYPRRDLDSSRAIREKFLDTVPMRFRDQVLTAQAIRRATEADELTWTQILTMASQFDARDFSRARPSEKPTGDAEGMLAAIHCCSCEHKGGQINVVTEENRHREDSRDRNLRHAADTRRYPSADRQRRDRPEGCHYCEKMGHIRKDCRKRLGLCLICGSEKHRVSTCPNRRSGREMVDRSGGEQQQDRRTDEEQKFRSGN